MQQEQSGAVRSSSSDRHAWAEKQGLESDQAEIGLAWDLGLWDSLRCTAALLHQTGK